MESKSCGVLDTPLEPVIGLAEGETRWRSMTTRCGAARLYTGRTSTTSGTKCFSKFWMPCCSVAVDEGQPAQEPFMLR